MNILKRATDDTVHLLEMGSDVFTVNAGGYILRDGEPFLIGGDPNTPGKPGLVIRDPLPEGDYFLINPYGEGAGVHSTPLNFFYRVLLSGLVVSLTSCTTNVLVKLIHAQQKKIESVPPEVLKVAAFNKVGDDALVDVIDARMAKEFDKIEALVTTRIHLIYPPKKMRVSLFFEKMSLEVLKEDLGKSVREKTIKVYLAIMLGILGCHNEAELDKFSTVYDPDMKAPPKLWCFLNSLLKVYLAMSGVLDDVGLFPKKMDLAELAAIIERVPEVFNQARHAIQVEYGQRKASASKPVARQTVTQESTRSKYFGEQPKQTVEPAGSFRSRMFGEDRPRAPMGRNFAPEPAVNHNGLRAFADDGMYNGQNSRYQGNSPFGGGPTRRFFEDTPSNRYFENSLTTRRFT